jgi:hypothetical protein
MNEPRDVAARFPFPEAPVKAEPLKRNLYVERPLLERKLHVGSAVAASAGVVIHKRAAGNLRAAADAVVEAKSGSKEAFQPNLKSFCRCVHDVNPLAHSHDVAMDFHRSQPIKSHASRDCNHGCS